MPTEFIEYQTPELTRELASRGFELGDYDELNPPPSTMPVEELIIRILTKNPDPRYILGIPVIIAKNNVNYNHLIDLARENSSLRRVGYLLEVTKIVTDYRVPLNGIEEYIEKIYKSLIDTMPEENLYNLSEKEKSIFREHVAEEGNELAVKWGIFAWGGTDTIKDKFELYNDLPRTLQEQRYAYMRVKYSKETKVGVHNE